MGGRRVEWNKYGAEYGRVKFEWGWKKSEGEIIGVWNKGAVE